MKRIAVIGSGGAGKSTFSLALAEALSIPVYHLDQIFWLPGWKALDGDEFAARQQQILTTPRWILDGNYGSTMDSRLTTADTIVFLDLPTATCLYRATKRYLRYRKRSRPTMTEGNNDRLTVQYLLWILSYRWTRRGGILERLERLRGDKRIFVLSSRASVDDFLTNLDRGGP